MRASAMGRVDGDGCALFNRLATVSGDGDLVRVRVIFVVIAKVKAGMGNGHSLIHKILIEITAGENSGNGLAKLVH